MKAVVLHTIGKPPRFEDFGLAPSDHGGTRSAELNDSVGCSKWRPSASQKSQGQIWKMRATGGPEIQVTRGGGYWSNESVDGSYLYYMSEEDLSRVPVSGSPICDMF